MPINGSHRSPRAGFTAIEMMVVVSIIIVLVAMTVPSIFPAIKKGRVHDAANAIMRASSQARQLARTRQQPPGSAVEYYGVAVVVPSNGKQAYATVIYSDGAVVNDGAAKSAELTNPPKVPVDSGGKAVCRLEFNRNVLPFKMDTPPSTGNAYTFMGSTTSAVSWFYQYRTGFVIKDPTAATTTINVGTAGAAAANGNPVIPAGIPAVFGVASLDQRYVVAISIYNIGLGNAQDMN